MVLEQLSDTASRVEGVREVHDLRARYSGSRILAELHIVVDPDLSVRRGHAIAKAVEAEVLRTMPDVAKIIIHVDPEPKQHS